ncbi:MAG: hypothetical protein WCS52_13890 [bacterium]
MTTRKSTVSKGHKQVGGFFISPHEVKNPKQARPYLEEIAHWNYSSAIMFVRHQRSTVLSPEVHDAVKEIVAFGHQCNIKMILDTDHAHWGENFVETCLEAALWAICPVDTMIHEGNFEFRVDFPKMRGQINFQEISAVFVTGQDGYHLVPPAKIQATPMHYLVPQAGLVIKGTMAGGYTGPAVFYVAVQTTGLVDVAHPQYLQAQKQLLDSYSDIPLDGFGWDEPGKGMGNMAYFKAGKGFLALFKKLNGYELRPNLIHLNHLEGTNKTIQVRCDYYRSLVEMNYVAQESHNTYAKKIFKQDLIFGTHQTWSGIPTDLAAGVLDYFKLGKVLTGAWTDGGTEVENKYPLHNFMLAEGLKKELGMRDAFYNDWAFRYPAVGNMKHANRLKMLFHVNWFSHVMSSFSEGLINFTQEPSRSAMMQDVENLDRFDEMVGDQFVPHTDVALLYSWETLAATPKWLTRMFYTFLANTAIHLTDAAQYSAIMSGESLLRAKIGKGEFSIDGLTYRVLLLPYIYVLPEKYYKRVMDIVRANVPVIVIGPPPEFTVQKQSSIAAKFAGEVGFKPFTLADYTAALAEKRSLPGINEWEPSWFDGTYPVQVTSAQKVFDQEGFLSYVKSPDRPLYYMPAPDPREDLTRLIRTLTSSAEQVFAEDTYYRFFRHRTDSAKKVLVAVTKGYVAGYAMAPDQYGGSHLRPPIKLHSLNLLARFEQGDLTLKGGSWCAVKIEGEKIVEVLGDCPDVRWVRGNA